jgi:hypothetical protein
MPFISIKLEEGEKLPTISTGIIGKKEIACPNCKERLVMWLCKRKDEKYIKGECDLCGYNKVITPMECDVIQPSSPLFELYYGFNPEKDNNKNKKQYEKYKDKMKEFREERINNKVKEGKLGTTDLKNIKSYIRDRGIE